MPTIAAPTFPLDALPPWLGDMARAVASSAQADINMAAATALGVVSAAVARKAVVALPGHRHGFPLHTWQMIIGEPTDGKSAVLDALSEPLRQAENILGGADPVAARLHRHPPRSTYQRLRDPWPPKEVAPTTGVVDAVRVIREAHVGHGLAGSARLLLDDITPNQLLTFLGTQATGASLISAEAGFETWLMQGGAVASQDAAALCKVWDGKSLTRQREGEPVPVQRPALTLLVGIQPETFARFAAHQQLRSRGFTLRFLFSRSVTPKRRYPAPALPQDVADAYEAHIFQLMTLPGWARAEALRIQVTREAAALNDSFMNRIEGRVAPGEDLRSIIHYARRLGSNLPRVAGLIHLARHTNAEGETVLDLPIDEDTMACAVAVCDYFAEEGAAVFGGGSARGGTVEPSGVGAMSLPQALRTLAAPSSTWNGLTSELLDALHRLVPDAERRQGWPQASNTLSRYLTDHAAEIEAAGVQCDPPRRTSRGAVVRLTLRRSPK